MPLKKKIFLIVSLLYILYTVVPIIPDVTRIGVWLVNLLTFVILLALYPRAFANPVMYWFMAYAAILAVYVIVGKPLTIGIGSVQDSKKVIIEYAFMLPSFSIFSILYYLKDYRLYRKIAIVCLLSIVISFLIIIPQILSNNNILRDAYLLYVNDAIRTPGIPNYLLMHAYVLLIPPTLYGIRINNGRRKWILLALLATEVFVLINTYVTTSIIITFAMIALVVGYRSKRRVRNFILMFFILLSILILHLSDAFVQMFDFLIDVFEGTAVQPKIEGFKYIYLFGNIDNSGEHITGRINLHDMSWKAFSENFMIGGISPVGGHSQLIDRLGGMGLVVFIPFIMMIFSQIKIMLRVITNSEQRFFYYLGLGAVFTILYQKGLFGQEGWLFLMIILPGLLITFRNSSMGDNLTQDIK